MTVRRRVTSMTGAEELRYHYLSESWRAGASALLIWVQNEAQGGEWGLQLLARGAPQ